MEPVSELTLLRLAALPVDAGVLLVHPPADALIPTLAARHPGRVAVWSWDARVLGIAARAPGVRVGGDPAFEDAPPAADFDWIVLFMPRARERLDLTLDLLVPRLSPAAVLILAGDNRSGVDSAARRLGRGGWNCAKGDAARHSQWWTMRPPASFASVSAEASEKAAQGLPEAFWKSYLLDPGGAPIGASTALQVCSLPGVFSHGELDEGTRLLLASLPAAIATCASGHRPTAPGRTGFAGAPTRVLDFGCGAGVLTLWLLATQPDWQVDALDIDRLALLSTRRSVAAVAGAEPRLGLLHADGLEELRTSYDLVVSNPPFHDGQRQDLATTRQFITACRARMRPGAGLVMVANRFLPYPESLQACFGHCQVLAETSRFRVYLAINAARTGSRGERHVRS